MDPVDLHPQADSAAQSPASTRDPASYSLHAQVRVLLLECQSRDELMPHVLRICSEQLGTSAERFDLHIDTQVRTRLSHDKRMQRSVAEQLNDRLMAPAAEAMLAGSHQQPVMKQYRHGEHNITLLSVPILNPADNQTEGAITLLAGETVRPEIVLPRLDSISAVIAAVLAAMPELRSTEAQDQAPPSHSEPNTAETVADPGRTVTAAKFGSIREFAFTLVNQLGAQIHAEQVLFGTVRNKRIHIQAISGLPDFHAGSPGITAARQAMEECLDAATPVIGQPTGPTEVAQLPLHRQWSVETGQSYTCSVPLIEEGTVRGVVSLRRSADHPLTSEELQQVVSSVAAWAPAIRLLERADLPPIRLALAASRDAMTSAFRQGSVLRWCLLSVVAAAILWFLLGSITYRPLCRARITPSESRHISAPWGGRLLRVAVEPGQTVRAGQTLLQFDTTTQQLERNRLQRDIAARQVELRQALSSDDISQAAAARARIAVLQTQAAAVQRQIDDAHITAPADGIVVLADLTEREGQTFAQGEELLEFAVQGGWSLQIEIPDDIIQCVRTDQQGTFAPDSGTDGSHSFLIEQLDGGAVVRDGRNVFLARGQMATDSTWFRSGMAGTARIETIPRPVWWVTLHRAVDWLRTRFWI